MPSGEVLAARVPRPSPRILLLLCMVPAVLPLLLPRAAAGAVLQVQPWHRAQPSGLAQQLRQQEKAQEQLGQSPRGCSRALPRWLQNWLQNWLQLSRAGTKALRRA